MSIISNKYIVISPYSQELRVQNIEKANYYPYWEEVCDMIRERNHYVVQALGPKKNRKLKGANIASYFNLKELELLIKDVKCHTWASVDNFMGHFGVYHGYIGVVIFGKSDPNLFGYKDNINLLKDRKYLRKRQFGIWEEEEFDPEVFVSPEEVVNAIFSIRS
jgi:hypothetical protein